MRSESGDKQRLLHILDAISEIENYTEGLNYEVYFSKSMVKSAVVFQLEIIGEAAGKLSESLKIKHSEIEWHQMTAVRNIIAHVYWGIDYRQVWEIIQKDLQALKNAIEKILLDFE